MIEETPKELGAHPRAEEKVFYPAVRVKGDEKLTEKLLEGFEEQVSPSS